MVAVVGVLVVMVFWVAPIIYLYTTCLVMVVVFAIVWGTGGYGGGGGGGTCSYGVLGGSNNLLIYNKSCDGGGFCYSVGYWWL